MTSLVRWHHCLLFKRYLIVIYLKKCISWQLAKLRMLESYYDFLNEYFSRRDFALCYMDTDSFYLAMSGDSFRWDCQGWDGAGISGRQEIGSQQTNIAREHLAYLSLNLLAQEVCDLPLSATLFKMRPKKINITVKVFQKIIMIWILNAIKIYWMFS